VAGNSGQSRRKIGWSVKRESVLRKKIAPAN
jgi:hypothetical protein